MGQRSKTSSELRTFWERKVRTWQQSGLSIRRFCTKHKLSEPSFYHWRRTLGLHPARRSQSASNDDSTDSFIRVSVPEGASHAMELVLSSGHVLRIGSGVDGGRLSQVLSALKQAGLC